jgi:cytoskeletal protein CcmA (bactofilin family)
MSTDAIPPLAPTPAGSTAHVGAGLHIKGEITGNEDLHVDGSIEGSIQLGKRKLTVGASGKVTADVVAREVVVYGTSKGNLRAEDCIEIKKDGSVVGELTTARIIIEDGAHFKGSIEIDPKTPYIGPDLDKPAYARAATATAHGNSTKST